MTPPHRGSDYLRLWSIPGLAAFTIYLLSTDTMYLFVGFCLLSGAAVDMWMTRALVASETLRIRLASRYGVHRALGEQMEDGGADVATAHLWPARKDDPAPMP